MIFETIKSKIKKQIWRLARIQKDIVWIFITLWPLKLTLLSFFLFTEEKGPKKNFLELIWNLIKRWICE